MFPRSEILERLRAELASGRAIIGAGAGSGLAAKCEEAGGADMIIVYNSGRFRSAGLSSSVGTLPYGDANSIVSELACEVLPIVKNVPVVAGVAASDPFRIVRRFLKELQELGFSGIQNFPTVGILDGSFREHLEHIGMGYQREIDLIAQARELDLLTTPYAFNAEQAVAMATAGADIVVAHVGRTISGMTGAKTSISLDDAAKRVQEIHDAAKGVNPTVMVICHGGPLARPADVEFIIQRTQGIDGFYGASSMERIPAEIAITKNMQAFKAIRLRDKVAAVS